MYVRCRAFLGANLAGNSWVFDGFRGTVSRWHSHCARGGAGLMASPEFEELPSLPSLVGRHLLFHPYFCIFLLALLPQKISWNMHLRKPRLGSWILDPFANGTWVQCPNVEFERWGFPRRSTGSAKEAARAMDRWRCNSETLGHYMTLWNQLISCNQ